MAKRRSKSDIDKILDTTVDIVKISAATSVLSTATKLIK